MTYQYIMSKLGQSEGELQLGLGSILEGGDWGQRQYSDTLKPQV